MDYYQLLEVPRTAHPDEIRKAFRRKAKMYHPDVNDDPYARGQFVKINEAYQVLNDAEKRKLYDQRLIIGFPPQVVYYRPAQPRYRARGDKYAHYRTANSAKNKYTRVDMLIDYSIFITLLVLGIISLFMGIYRLWIEKDDYIDPFAGLIMGSVFLGFLGIIWFNRAKFRE